MSIREVSRLVSGMCFLCMQATTRAKTGHPRKSLSYLFRHDSVVMAGGKGWCGGGEVGRAGQQAHAVQFGPELWHKRTSLANPILSSINNQANTVNHIVNDNNNVTIIRSRRAFSATRTLV